MFEGEGQDATRHEEICDKGLDEIEIPPVTAEWRKEVKKDEYQLNDISELSIDMRKSIERDFEFLKCATNVDRELLYSLLLSQINNSRRLETIMGDVLGIPQEPEIIHHFGGRNESSEGKETETEEKEKDSAKFLIQIREMFPDADVTFLANESRSLDTEEDCTRFINTVMLSGVYPKKIPVGNAPPDDEIEIIESFTPKPIAYSSDEEISSSGMIDSRHGVRKRRKTRRSDWLAGPSTSSFGFADEVSEAGESNSDVHVIADQQLMEKIQNLIRYPPRESEPRPDVLESDQSNSDFYSLPNSDVETGSVPGKLAREELPGRKSSPGKLSSPVPAEEDLEESTTGGTDPEDVSEEWLAEQTAELIRLFPNTDPSFLRSECAKFRGSLEAMNEFVLSKLEKNDMPSRADYEKRKELVQLYIRYTDNFSIEDFLKVIPNPWTYFSNSERNCGKYKLHSVIFLKSSFRKMYSRVITNTLLKNNFNLYLTYKELKQRSPTGRIRGRCDSECNSQRPTTIDIQFLQEVAFIKNEDKILDFIKTREYAKKLRFEEAKKSGNLLECQCCYDSEVMVEDTVYCPKDHTFCKPCLIKYVEVEMGQAKSQFPCLAGCGENYTLTALQNVLKPELFSKIIQANQMEEIQAAGIEDLVQCPFCNYATIMPPEVKVLPCLNPECQKESCRLCKELSHIPLRCDEVERSEEVKMRTYIENKMTEALIRTCYKCGKAFVKEEGCNKMECRCGAKMCYVCRKPVTGYSHFNGQGGTEYEKCPLYSTNDELHVDLVQRVAEEAKAEILQANPDKALKHDPTMVLPERSYDRPMEGINPGAAVAVGLLAFRRLHNVPFQQVAGPRSPAANNNNNVGVGNQDHHHHHHHHHHRHDHRHHQSPMRQGRGLRTRVNVQNRVNHSN